jgi:PAS domain S-box-containing protein
LLCNRYRIVCAKSITGLVWEKGSVIVTERRKTEFTLTEFEPRFRTFTEQSPNMIFINKNGRIVYANKKCEDIMGYSREEFLSPSFDFMSLIAPESTELVSANFKRHMNGEDIEPYEYTLIDKAGRRIEAIITSKLLDFEGERAFLGIVTDITARKLAEKELRKSEEKFRLAFQNGPIGMALCKMDGYFVQVNPAFSQMLGYTESELKQMKFQDLTPLEDLERQMPYYEKCLRGEIDKYQIEKRYLTKGGKKIWVNLTVAITKDEAQVPQYALIMAEDITEVKLAERNSQRLEAQLRQAQKMEAIGTLAGGIAHDFNNILGAIIGYTEMAVYDTDEGSMVRHNMQQVLKAGHRAKDLVKQILTFSRKSEQDKKIMSVTPVIGEVLKLLRASLPTTIDIQQHIPSDLGAIFADPTQIHQVLMNLCTNSAHAMEKSGGLLEVVVSNEDFSYEQATKYSRLNPGRYVRLTVRDTGCGMDATTLERIFDPYFTTKTKDKGTGMGLAVVHGIVKGHNGGIRVVSAPNKGTTVEIVFPMTARQIQSPAVTFDALPAGGERILFVDDEETLIDLAQRMLAKLGYQVVTETNPLDALKTFESEPDRFDLVISDMTMPNMTGLMMAREIMSTRSNIPIIICTGYSEQISEEKANEMGVKGFLMKPLTLNALAAKVRTVLDGNK